MGMWKSWWSTSRGRAHEPGRARRARALVRLAGLLLVSVLPLTTAGADRPAIAAHRGGARLWPENSLTAFRGALGLGVDLVELDVHQTRDGEVVVLHDPTLERTTAGRTYKLFFSGAKLHIVAFQADGGTYWVVNTLRNRLSNETMLAIAKGLQPLGS